MKTFLLGFTVFLLTISLPDETINAAHILEPLGTEISATPPRGRIFGQIEYAYSKIEPKNGETTTSHTLPVEFEIGVGERSQLNLEAEILLEETNGETENGIEEMAFGLKHRFLDETQTLPDMAFLMEFAPAAGLEGNEAELKATLLATKNLTSRFLIHLESGYLHETEREIEVEGTVIGGEVSGEGIIEVENTGLFIYNIAPVFKVIPDRLLLIVELNGKSNFKSNENEVTITPEVILVVQDLAIKGGVPFGLTDESQELGIHIGISKLF